MDDRILVEVGCCRCECAGYAPRLDAHRTVSFTDLPVSQGARDLYERYCHAALFPDGDRLSPLDILAAADPRDVRSLLWARRAGKL